MDLKELIEHANNLADDFLEDSEAEGFINDAIAAINIEVGADFPFLEEEDDIPAFPEKWQRMLIIPFAKGRIKEKDSSEFEWSSGYEQFFANLAEFKIKYDIPEEFLDSDNSFGNVSDKSMIDSVPFVWGGW